MSCKALVASFLSLIDGIGEDNKLWVSEGEDYHVELAMKVLNRISIYSNYIL